MNSIKYACSLNNQGVDLLLSGESARAIKAFQFALCLLKRASVNEAETISCTEINASCDDGSMPFSESISAVSGLQGLLGYVYDHGIMITDSTLNGQTEATISLYIAIVLFNLALASHTQGTALGREKLLKKASLLYSLAVQLLTRCIMPEDKPTTILILLALNNKAQILYDQCDYTESIDCMKYISQIMGSGRGLTSTLRHEDIWGLIFNVMLLSTPAAAHAA
jgi:tetratricopeptide (TPR) repeat protein